MLEKLKKIITDATPEEINTAAIIGATAITVFLMTKLITPDPANKHPEITYPENPEN